MEGVLVDHDERAAEIDRFRGNYVNSTGDGLLATSMAPRLDDPHHVVGQMLFAYKIEVSRDRIDV
jgi:hypothetical protein